MTAMSSLNNSYVQLSAFLRVPSSADAAQAPGWEWDQLALELQAALQHRADTWDWLERVLQVRSRARVLAARDMDAALLHGLQALSRNGAGAVGAQALCRMLVASEVARALGYGATLIAHLERAALMLSVPMVVLRERMGRVIATQPGEPVAELLRRYAEDAVLLALEEADGDPVWLDAVRQHRVALPVALPPTLLTSAQHLAVLLRRVDRFCTRMALSHRAPVTTLQAASGTDAQADAATAQGAGHDPIGAALVKAVGLYPLGSLVQLESGEAGMVLARGRRAEQPLVAVFADLRRAQPLPLNPQLSDTAHPGRAVSALLCADQLRLPASLQALLQLRTPGSGMRAA